MRTLLQAPSDPDGLAAAGNPASTPAAALQLACGAAGRGTRVLLSSRAHQEAEELTSGLQTALIHLCFRLN